MRPRRCPEITAAASICPIWAPPWRSFTPHCVPDKDRAGCSPQRLPRALSRARSATRCRHRLCCAIFRCSQPSVHPTAGSAAPKHVRLWSASEASEFRARTARRVAAEARARVRRATEAMTQKELAFSRSVVRLRGGRRLLSRQPLQGTPAPSSLHTGGAAIQPHTTPHAPRRPPAAAVLVGQSGQLAQLRHQAAAARCWHGALRAQAREGDPRRTCGVQLVPRPHPEAAIVSAGPCGCVVVPSHTSARWHRSSLCSGACAALVPRRRLHACWRGSFGRPLQPRL